MTRAKKMVFLCMALAMVVAFSAPSWAGDAGKINLNKATAAELSQLKGIGMKYAERIVQYRDKNGPFKNVEDLIAAVEAVLAPNVTLLVKGSRFMQMERVVRKFEL